MKQIILFIVIFALGALTYSFLNPFLISLQKETPSEERLIVPSAKDNQEINTSTTTEAELEVEAEDVVTITADGSLLDGPFLLKDAQGNTTDATVQIVRSPEETLLQFKNFAQTHSSDSDIYFATDLKATTYLSLGFAKLKEGVEVYGIPLDADLSKYSYILIYNVKNQTTEFSAQIK